MNEIHTQFKVVEFYDQEKNKIWRVELQYKQDVKDQYGGIVLYGNWIPVTRERMNISEVIS